MAVRLEHSGNAAATTITTSITNASTAINIASAAGWPTGSVGPFVVTLDAGTASEEKVLVLSRTGTALTVQTRGYDGTTATAHANGAAIAHTFSATEADEANALAAQATAGTAMATTTGPQTLANKTLTSPVVNNPAVVGGSWDTPMGRRNVIRNGDFSVGQRTSPWTTSGVYTSDGWIMSFTGGTMTVSRQATPAGTGLGQDGALVSSRSVVATQSAAGDFAMLSQRIEGVRTLAGKTVTLSFTAAASAGTPKIGVEVEQNFGTGGSPSATVQTAVQAVTISTAATRYTVTFTVPSISGKTLGTGGNDYLQINLWLSAGTTFAARSSTTGIQNTTIDITDVQLEQGGATAFERLDPAAQLAWCQRYFVRIGAVGNVNHPLGIGIANGATTVVGVFRTLPTKMRSTPSLATGGNWRVRDGVTGTAATSITADNLSPDACLFTVTVASGLTQFRPYVADANNDGTAFVDLTAEL